MIRPAQVLVPLVAFGGRSLLSACSVLNPVSVTVVCFDEVPRASKPLRVTWAAPKTRRQPPRWRQGREPGVGGAALHPTRQEEVRCDAYWSVCS